MKWMTVVGGGLAGSEATLQLATNGIKVMLYDRKPSNVNGVYSLEGFAELVCNNSFGLINENKPSGMLLKELRENDSQLLNIAELCRLNDDRYFAIDVRKFSQLVTEAINKNPNIIVINECVNELPTTDNIVIATGPMTHKRLAESIAKTYKMKDYAFSDSSCPIVAINDIDLNNPNIEKKNDDLYLIHIPPKHFAVFTERLKTGEIAIDHATVGFVTDTLSHPIEKLATENIKQLCINRFSVIDNRTIIHLRRVSALQDGFILAGCTTQLKNTSQVNAFSALPGFKNIKTSSFIRFGRMHKNTFFITPHKLDCFFRIKQQKNAYLIGQISGVDGYAPAIASGLVAARRIIHGERVLPFASDTMIGALARYVSNSNPKDYNPIGAVMNLITRSDERMLEPIWKNIVAHKGEQFSTKRNSPFTYTTIKNETIEIKASNAKNDKIYKISKSDFAKVLSTMPIDGPNMINNLVRRPSYIYAILKDRRIVSWAE